MLDSSIFNNNNPTCCFLHVGVVSLHKPTAPTTGENQIYFIIFMCSVTKLKRRDKMMFSLDNEMRGTSTTNRKTETHSERHIRFSSSLKFRGCSLSSRQKVFDSISCFLKVCVNDNLPPSGETLGRDRLTVQAVDLSPTCVL